MLTIVFDGVAHGMLLLVLACGLVVLLGLKSFANLAHGAFAIVNTTISMNKPSGQLGERRRSYVA